MADFSQNLAYPLAASVLLGIILSVVAAFIVTLNVISVYTFATNQSLRSFSDRFIFSLACSDTGVGICACVRVIMTLLGTHWPWSYNFCLQFNTWEIWTNFSTEMNSFVIALNCYFQLTSPDAYIRRQSPGLQKAIITAVWTTVFLFFALPMLIWDSIIGRDPTVNQEGSCSYPFAHNIPFSLYFLFVPLSFIAGGPVTNIFTTFIHKRVYRQQLIDILHPHKDKVVEIMTRLELGDNEDLVQRVRDATHLLLQADFAMKARNKVKGPESRPKAKYGLKIIGEKSSSSSSVSSSMSSSLVVAASSSKPASPGSLQLKVGMLTRNSMMVTPGKTGNLFVKSQSNTTSNNVISNAKTAESEGSIITLIFPSSKDTRDATKEAENRTQAIEEVIGALRRCQITNQEFILAQAINFVETCCCTPFVSLGMLATLCDLYPSLNCAGAFPPWLLHMSLWLVMVNSGINPILYYTFDQKYQTALLETLIKIGIRRPAISNLPGEEPSNQPSSQPINQPANEPSNQPSSEPINQPANEPANQPSSQPTNQPAIEPNNEQRNVPATII